MARKPAYTELEDYVFCLRRGPEGDFDSVYLLDHDGCEDEWNFLMSDRQRTWNEFRTGLGDEE